MLYIRFLVNSSIALVLVKYFQKNSSVWRMKKTNLSVIVRETGSTPSNTIIPANSTSPTNNAAQMQHHMAWEAVERKRLNVSVTKGMPS
jgi:hypothetical protein